MKILNKPIFATATKKANKEMMFSIEEIVSLLSIIPELKRLGIRVNEVSKDRVELIVGYNTILILNIDDK